MNNNIGLRIVSVLVLIAAIAGIGFFAYQAGVANGSPVTIEASSGETVPAPHYAYGYRYHPFGFGFGCFGPLLGFFLIVLALKSFRMLFWGPRWGWGGHHSGHRSKRWEGSTPPIFDEWHKKAHNEEPEKDEKE
ncbi:MAG TPA: hypothetical protein VLA72_01425 [Anaerolineales bacterium]|nr:hypothetical protein [Anaerolineales bacterium]